MFARVVPNKTEHDSTLTRSDLSKPLFRHPFQRDTKDEKMEASIHDDDSAFHQEDPAGVILHEFLKNDTTVEKAFYSLKGALQPKLLHKLKNVKKDELTVNHGLEIAASIDLLKFFNVANVGLKDISKRAREGAMLLEEGEKLVNKGKNMLGEASNDIPKHIK